jgi:hypothetical protein
VEEKLYLRNRGDGDYFLESRTNNSASVIGSLNPTHFAEHKLSLKNCESIAIGLDIELFSAHYGASKVKSGKSVDYGLGASEGFEEGFQKAVEILGDKKFSEEDMESCWDASFDYYRNDGKDSGICFERFLKSLQQTEWEVEIEMDMTWVGQCNCPCHSNEVTIMHIMACCHPKMVESPILDSDGCLILKRK